MTRFAMLRRAIALFLASALSVQAQDPPVLFPLETSGGRWTGYEPAGAGSQYVFSQLQKRGEDLLMSGTYSLAVNRLTGIVNPTPRAAFSAELEYIVCDGESPVFWTRTFGEDPDRPYFLRDWTTGEKVGEVAMPSGLAPSYIDPHGSVAVTGLAVRATDPMGGMVRDATFASLGISGYDFKVTGCQDWLALTYSKIGGDRMAILNRATLALAGDHPLLSRQITMEGDLLAARVNNPWSAETAMLYRLPALTPITGLPNDLPTDEGVRQLKLADGNLWILQQLSNQNGCAFLQYDLSELPAIRLRQRVSPPGRVLPVGSDILPWVATGDFLGIADAAGTLWVWNRDPVNDPYQPLLKIEPWQAGPEGGVAQARLVLSDPVDWPVQVSLSARSGSAVEGTDFAPWSQTVTIPAGQTYALAEVPLLADTTLEENETFEVVIGQVTGALAENSTTPLVITGNGHNLEYNPLVFSDGKLRWTHIYGSNGRVLIGLANVTSPATGFSAGLVIADIETGNVIANHAGVAVAPNTWKCEFRDNLVIVVAYGYFTAYRIDTGAEVAKWPLSDHEVVGMVDATKILTRVNSPRELRLRQLSDGALLTSAPFAEDASITLSKDARDGTPSSIFLYRSARAAAERLTFNRLSELNRDTLAATELTAWRSFKQSAGDNGELLAVWQDKLLMSVSGGLTAVNRHTGAPLWHLPAAVNFTTLYGHGITGNVMALQGLFTGEPDSSNFVRFIDLDRGVVLDELTPQQLSPDGQWWESSVIAYQDGWVITSRSKSYRVLKTPVRPNVKIVAPVIPDNAATALRAVPREGFPGTYPIRISEFVDLAEDRPAAACLLSGLPIDLQVDADGVDFTVSATRPVNGFENTRLRATAPGRKTLLSGSQQVVVDSHLVTVPNGAFTTGGPVRSTRGRSVAVSEPLLAVGFPLEPLAGGTRTGVVDLYERLTGAFLRSIEAPAGTEDKRFGHEVAFSGNKLVVGAPGAMAMGRVFVYNGTTGALIQELKLKGKSGGFGSDIQANERWIAVSAPGPSRPMEAPENLAKETGTVMVFDATTLKARFAKTTKGEFLGSSMALNGDRLHVSAPGAHYQKLYGAGMVRAYNLPKGKLVGTIMAREPKALGSFGSPIAASDDVVFMGAPANPSLTGSALQVQAASNLGFLGYYTMPGDRTTMLRVLAHDGWMIGGEDTLRFFRAGNLRPAASRKIVDPGGDPNVYPGPYFYRSNIAAIGNLLYWADRAPKVMAMPEIPAAATSRMLANAEAAGRDPFEKLSLHRGDASLPARAILQESTTGGLQFLLEADLNVPPGMDLWFEVSADLNRWDPVLQWQHDSPGWRDESGALLEVSPDARVGLDHRSETKRVFFRTRAASR